MAKSGDIKADERPWLVMLYLAGDDLASQRLRAESSVRSAINDMIERIDPNVNRAGPERRPAGVLQNPNMHLVILADGVFLGDGAAHVRVYHLVDTGLADISHVIKDAPWRIKNFGTTDDPELDTGDFHVLREFVRWARKTFPARHTMLSLVGHGGGWSPDFGIPGQPNGHPNDQPGWRGMCMDMTHDTSLSNRDVRRALNYPLHSMIDVLFFDACLMGMIECAYEVHEYANYLIAGEDMLYAQLPYEEYLKPEVLTATTTPRELAEQIVHSYDTGLLKQPFVIAALDVSQVPALAKQVGLLAALLLRAINESATPELRDELCQKVQAAYQQAQKLNYHVRREITEFEGYVDLRDFALRLQEEQISEEVTRAAGAIIEKVGGEQPEGARGDPDGPAVTPRADTPAADAAGNQASDAAVVVRLRRQSGQGDLPLRDGQFPIWDFDHAHGLSIYLPLGEQDLRPSFERQPDGTWKPISALEFYKSRKHLLFTSDQETRAWVDLIATMVQFLIAHGQYGRLASEFNTPTLLQLGR
jgi:hypothetical protein